MALPGECPECGLEVQATVKVHLSKQGNRWVFAFDDGDGIIFGDNISFYCANDHDLDELAENEDFEAIDRAIKVQPRR